MGAARLAIIPDQYRHGIPQAERIAGRGRRGLAYLVDEGLGRQDPELLNEAVIGTPVIAFVLAARSYLRTTLVNQIGESVLADVRRAVFGHLMTLPPAWYESARTGDVLARITTDSAIV